MILDENFFFFGVQLNLDGKTAPILGEDLLFIYLFGLHLTLDRKIVSIPDLDLFLRLCFWPRLPEQYLPFTNFCLRPWLWTVD